MTEAALSREEKSGKVPVRDLSRADARFRRLNTGLSVFLLTFLAVSPLPFGSNRPAFWTLAASGMALAGSVYGSILAGQGGVLRYRPGRIWGVGLLFLAIILFLIFQILPLGLISGPILYESVSGAVLPATGFSLVPGETVLMLVKFCGCGIFFLLMLQVAANRDRARNLLRALTVIFAAYALYGMLALTQFGDTLLFFEKWAYQGVATGPFVNRNSFATFLAIGMTVAAAQMFREMEAVPKRSRRGAGLAGLLSGERFAQIGYIIVFAILLLALVATQSRMGLFSGVVGVIFVSLIAARKISGASGRVLVLIVLAGTIGGGVLLVFSGALLDRLESVGQAADLRASLYSQVWQMILARPLTGFGGGSFELAFPLYHQLPVSPDVVWDKAHSTYLGLWSELGLIFGSMPMAILLIFGIMALRRAWIRDRDWAAPAAASGALLVSALHSLVDFSLEIQANAYMLLAIVALAIAEMPQKPAQNGISGGKGRVSRT